MQRAMPSLLALIVLCSGCAARLEIPPAPLILNLPDCPAPAPPKLPMIDGAAPLDSPKNVGLLLERDDVLRAYIAGLNAAIRCYQTRKEP